MAPLTKEVVDAFAVFKLGDARPFSGLTSKIPPKGLTLNFDADVKQTTTRHSCCENRFSPVCEQVWWGASGIFTLHDTWSFSGLTSTIPPLGQTLNFDADVKQTLFACVCAGLVGSIGNVIVIVTTVKNRPLRAKPQLLLHLSLAVSDLGTSVRPSASETVYTLG